MVEPTGVGRKFARGVVLNGIFHESPFCTDVFPYTLYRKCITFASKKAGGGGGGGGGGVV